MNRFEEGDKVTVDLTPDYDEPLNGVIYTSRVRDSGELVYIVNIYPNPSRPNYWFTKMLTAERLSARV